MPTFTNDDMINAEIATSIRAVLSSFPAKVGIMSATKVTATVDITTGETSWEIVETAPTQNPTPKPDGRIK